MTKLLAMLALFAAALLAACGAKAEGIATTIEPQKSSYALGEPVLVRCTFTNQTQKVLPFDLGSNDAANVTLVLKSNDAKGILLPYIVRRGGGDFASRVPLSPGQTITRYLVIDQWWHPRVSGVYAFEFRCNSKGLEMHSNFEIHVGKVDEKQIMQSAIGVLDGLKRERGDESNPFDFANYLTTSCLFISYLESPAVLAELRKHYSSDAFLSKIIDEGETMGPGGCRILD
jgi:hypothetical protein